MRTRSFTMADLMLFATFFALGYMFNNFLRTKRDEKEQLNYLIKKFNGEKTEYEHVLFKSNKVF
jgi:hypothetical protein